MPDIEAEIRPDLESLERYLRDPLARPATARLQVVLVLRKLDHARRRAGRDRPEEPMNLVKG